MEGKGQLILRKMMTTHLNDVSEREREGRMGRVIFTQPLNFQTQSLNASAQAIRNVGQYRIAECGNLIPLGA